jgi:hypothetical protein
MGARQRLAHPYARNIAGMLEQAGFLHVALEHEVAKALVRSQGRAFIPFDISYLSLRPMPHFEFIECKYRHPNKTAPEVSEQDVAKFISDLRACGLSYSQGAVVTNTRYRPLAIDYARSVGLRLYIAADTPQRSKGGDALLMQLLNRPMHALRSAYTQLHGAQALPAGFVSVT